MPIVPFHRIGALLYNRPLTLVPASLFSASDYLLSRIDGQQVNQFVGERRTDDAGNRLPYRVTEDGTAVISILGELVNRSMGWADADCGLVSYEYIQHQCATADADTSVRDLFLDLDSPGGDSAGCFTLADFIRKVAARKPVVAYVNAKALSGGYAIASAATRIIAPRDSEVGSIGVWMLHYDLSKHLEQHGVKPTLLWRGARKVDGHPYGPLSQEAEEKFGHDLDRIYDMFVGSVAAGRKGLSTKAIQDTEAACFYAEDALRIGLIDQVGTFDDAMATLKSLHAGAKRTAPALITVKSRKVLTPSASARTEAKMETCATEGCGHEHDKHPDDGACTVEGCSCQGYTAAPADAPPADEPAAQSRTETPDQRIARLEAENRNLRSSNHAEAQKRISAEVKQFGAALLTKSDLRFNTQEVAALGHLLTVAKSAVAGIGVATLTVGDKVRSIKTDGASVGAFVVEQIGVLTAVGAKFEPPTGELPAPKQSAAISGVTLADFNVAATDTKASSRISAAVKSRRKETKNDKYSKDDLYRELAS